MRLGRDAPKVGTLDMRFGNLRGCDADGRIWLKRVPPRRRLGVLWVGSGAPCCSGPFAKTQQVYQDFAFRRRVKFNQKALEKPLTKVCMFLSKIAFRTLRDPRFIQGALSHSALSTKRPFLKVHENGTFQK